MRNVLLSVGLPAQFVVSRSSIQRRIAMAVTLFLSAMASPLFAQFGGTVNDLEARFGEPTKKVLTCELDHVLPKLTPKQQEESQTTMARWEAKKGGATLSVWSYKNKVHGISVDAMTTEGEAISCINKKVTTSVNKAGLTTKPKSILWNKVTTDLMTPFLQQFHENEQTVSTKFVPPRIEQQGSIATFFNGTDDTVDFAAVTNPQVVNKEEIAVDVFKTWRRVVSADEQRRFVFVYDAYDLLVTPVDKKQANLHKSSTVSSFMVMTMPLYLAANVRLGENLRSGNSTKSEYLDKFTKKLSSQEKDTFYAGRLLEAVDHPDVDLDWLDFTQVKPNELKDILDEMDLKGLSLTPRIRRIEALASRGVLSKLVGPVIDALKNKKTQQEAAICLNSIAKKLSREPDEDFGFDFKKWDGWYKAPKK